MHKDSSMPVAITGEMRTAWMPALESHLGANVVKGMSKQRQDLLIAMSQRGLEAMIGTEAASMVSTPNNTTMAMNVLNPTSAVQTGDTKSPVSPAGAKGSGDRQYLIGICVSLAAKTIGLELVQTVPATSQTVTIRHLNVIYNGGEVTNAANNRTHVVTLEFEAKQSFIPGAKYIVGATIGGKFTYIELKYVKPDRKGAKFYIFEVGGGYTATNGSGTLTDITGMAAKPAVGAIVAESSAKFYTLNESGSTTITNPLTVASIENTNAVENFAPGQTTKGYNRLLTRSEADAGTDRNLELDLKSVSHTIRNRVLTGNISRLNYKRLEEQGIATIPYLTAALKNEFAQDINYQIISAVRSEGLVTALEYQANGLSFNTFIGPKSKSSETFSNLPYADQLFDMDGNPVASQFNAMPNVLDTMQYENIASIGNYLCMLITEACYAIGTDSRYGEGDAVVLPVALAGFVSACSKFTKLSERDVDMTAGTGAKLSGYIDGIKVYVDVNAPMDSPYVTVLRSNQDVKVDVPGIEGDTILVPGLAYLVKDLISSTELVPSDTGGKKLICDSETDLIEVGDRAHAAYCTFAFYCNLPGLRG